MTPLIIGNWKLHGSQEMVQTVLKQVAKAGLGENVAVCVPAPYLSQAKRVLKESVVRIGSQDVSQFFEGAYTGEISGRMLRDIGCTLTLVGHSERRAYFAETSDLLARKAHQAIEAGLYVIFCVGENIDIRQSGQAISFVLNELKCLKNLPLGSFAIAYEPVWAIGTGLAATAAEIGDMHIAIKEYIGQAVPVLYGGSVKVDNAAEILTVNGVNGLLIGGASLKADEFIAIGHCAKVG